MAHLFDPRIKVEDEDYDIDIDQDEDGGIHLDVATLSTADTLQIKARYHQSPLTSLVNTNMLWQLPIPPLQAKDGKLKNRGINHPIEIWYHKLCRLINKHWHTSPTHCLPADLQQRTPYSFAMLAALRRLASRTKNKFPRAQSLLLDCWKNRIAGLTVQNEGNVAIIETYTKQYIPNQWCEDLIYENAFGLTLEDAWRAFEVGKRMRLGQPNLATIDGNGGKAKKAARKQAKVARGLGRDEQSNANVADRVTKRRRANKAARAAQAQPSAVKDELVEVDIGFIKQESPTSEGNWTAAPDYPVSTSRHLISSMNETSDTQISDDGGIHHNLEEPQSNGNLSQPSRRDKRLENGLSRRLGQLDFRPTRGRRVGNLRQGGWSRNAHQKVSMPLELANFNSLPSLHVLASDTSGEVLTKLGQLRLPSSDHDAMNPQTVKQEEDSCLDDIY